jgi:endonuclease/exonuclease/phosphatase family metal-dependent hydrolase
MLHFPTHFLSQLMSLRVQRGLRARVVLLAAIALLSGGTAARAEQLRVVTQNAENFSGQSDRLPAFRTIMRNIGPDLACLQEITSSTAVSQLLSQVFLQINDDWAAVPFHNGPDTDNAFFYRTSKLQLVSTRYIPTTLRDIAEYVVRPAAGDTTLHLCVYSLHLKANSGTGDNVERRRQEATVLRQQLDQFAPGSLLMVCGDYNLLSSDEPAYQLLLAATPLPNGQLFDPIDTPGHWESNPAFAETHTISANRLNARFDFILVSVALMDTVGSYVLPATYRAYGNDGLHFGRAVNSLPNDAVPDSVAQALYDASDHLPLVTDFILDTEGSGAGERPTSPSTFGLMKCYPNPFNPVTTILYSLPRASDVNLSVFDVTGRLVRNLVTNHQSLGGHSVEFDATGLSSGIYFVRLETGEFSQVQKLILAR